MNKHLKLTSIKLIVAIKYCSFCIKANENIVHSSVVLK